MIRLALHAMTLGIAVVLFGPGCAPAEPEEADWQIEDHEAMSLTLEPGQTRIWRVWTERDAHTFTPSRTERDAHTFTPSRAWRELATRREVPGTERDAHTFTPSRAWRELATRREVPGVKSVKSP